MYHAQMELTLPDNFGKGIYSACAYDTGWVARVPSPQDPRRPAFEKSLQWLRQNQLGDGSWGVEHPLYTHDRLLSTVRAILTLKHWNFAEDQQRIDMGIKATNYFLEHIRGEYIRAQFIIFFYPLLAEAIGAGMAIVQGDIVDYMRNKYHSKTSLLKNLIKYKWIMRLFVPDYYNLRSIWLYGLEGFVDMFTGEAFAKMVAHNGIIGHNYSATAFALIENPKLKTCLEALNRFVDNDCADGGIPGSAPEEIFGLSWSIGFLHMAGVDLRGCEKLRPFLDELESAWIKEKGLLAASVMMAVDSDDIANTLFALNSAGRLTDVKYTKPLLTLFKKNSFITFAVEKNPTLTTNIHCLLAIKRYESDHRIGKVVAKTKAWIKGQMSLEMSHDQFVDKWHISYIYPLSRAVCAFIGTDDEFALQCLTLLMANQNSDGGWGMNYRSSLEETAFVVLALYYWLNTGHNEQSEQIECILKTAKQYMNDPNNESIYPFWFAKTLYSPVDIVATLITAAKYALIKF